MHTDEIPFVFGEPLAFNNSYTKSEERLSRHMIRYWSNFAKTNNPNGDGRYSKLRTWPEYKLTNSNSINKQRAHLDLNSESINIGFNFKVDYCAFWDIFLPKITDVTISYS